MDNPAAGNWAGLLFFLALGGYFIQKAVRQSAVRRWNWGRAGEGAPLSRTSYAIWGSTFWVIGAGIACRPDLAAIWGGVFLLCFVALFAAGLRDARAEKKKHRDSQ